MPQRLTKFRVRKVSLVPWGANDEPITFKKSAADNEVVLFKSAGVDSMSKLKKDDAPPYEKKEDEKKDEEEKKEEVAEEEKKEEGTQKSASGPVFTQLGDEIKKAVDAAVAPLRQENVELRKALDEERALRETREYIQKAADTMPNLGNPAEIGSLLLSIDKSNLTAADKDAIQSLLLKANEANSYLFKSIGYSGPSPVEKSAAAEINEKAREMVQKSDRTLDIATARNEIRKLYPDLARREREEESAAARRGF